ncbi:MAG: hypothetical protein IJ688_14725 [Treponema sp.]|nr:hypothetical protein [Treponema sp.]
MKYLKKSIAVLIAASSLSFGFAQVSIGGVSVQNTESQKMEIETKYGKFTVKSGFPVERYESGAIKSFYIEDFGQPLYNAKLKHPDYGEIIVATPVPKEDYLSQQAAQALEFWENGNIKTLKLADIKYSYNEGGYFRIKFDKYKESLSVFPKSRISFYENGMIESLYVANGQSFKFLRDASINTKSKAAFKNQSKVSFYNDGSIKEYSPQNAKITNPLNFKIKDGTSVIVSKDNPTMAIGFYPATGSSLALGDSIIIKCLPTEPVYFYENATSLKQISWFFDTVNFTLGNVHFYSGLNGERVSQTVYFNEDGTIKTVTGIMETSFDGTKKLSTYPTLIEGQAVNVRQIDYDNNGNMVMADLGRNPIELSSAIVKDGIQSIKAWKLYYKDAKKVAAIGNIHLQSSKGNFYDTNADAILLLDGDKIIKTIKPQNDEKLTADSTILFDKDGNITGYTAINSTGLTVETKLN